MQESVSVWQWQRLIKPDDELDWRSRFDGIDASNIAVISSGEPLRCRVTIFSRRRDRVIALKRLHGGRVALLKPSDWQKGPAQAVPLRVRRDLFIVENAGARGMTALRKARVKVLVIPAGMAFGSGSHATTGMILREMGKINHWAEQQVLDLGTGSGILALAARQMGAKRIVAIDNDPIAIRVSRENEVRNFARSTIKWRRADLTVWKTEDTYSIVTANLYSALLCLWAKRIWAAVTPEGQVILCGILVHQESEVQAVWRRVCKIKPVLRRRKGRWVMLVFVKGDE
jgi:ribosomal protein L11 methyltransferase